MFTKILFSAALTGALALACSSKESGNDGETGGAAPAGSSGTNAGTEASGASGTGTAAGHGGSNAGSGGSEGAGRAGSGGAMSNAGSAGRITGGSAGSDATTGGSGGTSSAGGPEGGGSGESVGGSSAGTAPGGAGGSGATGGGGGLVNADPSEGCSLATPSSIDGRQTFDLDGSDREFIIRLPEGYDGSAPQRLIFAFHGASGSADQVDKGDPPNTGLEPTGPYYGIKEHADNQTIFVAGQAASSWNDGDVAYVETLVAKFEAELCIDKSRILATGFSMGGIMTLRVACNLSDVFRAVAPMSCSLSAANCGTGGGPIAYWSSHGEQDTTINISNGEAARDEFAERNGCDMDTTPIGSNGCEAYSGCDEGYPVNWCPFMGIHEPPTFSGPEIWAFLSQF